MQKHELLLKAGDIVSAFVSRNEIASDQILVLLDQVSGKLFELAVEDVNVSPVPPVPIEESYTDEYIICLEDQKKVAMLSRHLKRHHGMTVEEYFKKWNLPEDYPIVAKSYSEKRSKIAKDQGLGRN